MDKYDVVIAGGGTAGVVAAAQAARAGARTLLVEKTGMLGGTMTMAAVDFPGIFHAWGRQVVAGIGWELVARCVRESGGTLPDFSTTPARPWMHQVRINPAVYAVICDDAVVGSGADLLLHTMVAAIRREGDIWKMTLCAKGGLRDVEARVLIDCTGDADAVRLAGGPVAVHEEKQPGTLVWRVGGYDVEKLDLQAINDSFDAAVREGLLSYADIGWSAEAGSLGAWLRRGGGSSNHVRGISELDSEGRTRMEVEGRRLIMRLFRFLKRQPGLEGITIDFMAPECGVRETAIIVGEETVTLDDYVSGRAWPDAVCHAFYPIDLHMDSGAGLDCRPLLEGIVPTVPRGALIPKGLPNLLAAGRCISSDRLANSALRVQAASMATGQATGALAALAARSGVDVRSVPMPELRGLLESHGAIVPTHP